MVTQTVTVTKSLGTKIAELEITDNFKRSKIQFTYDGAESLSQIVVTGRGLDVSALISMFWQEPPPIPFNNIRRIRLFVEDTLIPEVGKKWQILYGDIHHLTGNNSFALIQQNSDTTIGVVLGTARVADATGRYPLFNNTAIPDQSQFALYVLDWTQRLYFSGNATVPAVNCYCDIWVLEF
jgi:hypothetical protein